MKKIAALIVIVGTNISLAALAQKLPNAAGSSKPVAKSSDENVGENHYPTENAPLPVRVIQSPSDATHDATRERDADQRDKDNLDAYQRSAEAAEKQVMATWWQFGLACFGTAALLWTLYETRRTAKASVISAKAAQDSVQAAIRAADIAAAIELPIIYIKNIRLRLSQSSGSFVPFPPPVPFYIEVSVKNLGRSTAFVTETCVLWRWDENLPDDPQYDFTSSEPIAAGGTINPESQATPISTYKIDPHPTAQHLWTYGFIAYKDFLGEEWQVGFCAKWSQGLTEGGFVEIPNKNYIYKRKRNNKDKEKT